MSWRSPPSRRELTLVLFSLTVFILFYNLDTSFRLLGVDPAGTQSALMSKLGFRKGIIGTDGRRPPGWRDPLEGEIFGDWGWEEGHVAGNGAERQKVKGEDDDRYGAIWLGKAKTGAGEEQQILNEGTAADAFAYWEDRVPKTTVVKHVPGYTILDSVILVNGTVWLVTDDLSTFPALGSIASSPLNSSKPPQDSEWQILTTEQATKLGNYGALIRGVTWISTDTEPNNHTLLSLWRTYATLDQSIDSLGRTTLPPPRRLIFPSIPYFSEPRRDPDNATDPRNRSKTGIDDLAAKAAFPTMAIMYREDWNDFAQMQIPFVLERVVVADRGAAARASGSQPVFSPPFQDMVASKHWWQPVRRVITGFLQLPEESKKSKSVAATAVTKPIVTYLSTQEKGSGPRLKDEDHNLLVKTLKKFQRTSGYEVNIISANAPWADRMRVLVRSTIVIGVYGTNLADTYFMKPSPHTTLMEFFPSGYFSRDQELPARYLGYRYIAWWNDRKLSGSSLPATAQPQEGQSTEIPINPAATVKAIREAIETPTTRNLPRALDQYPS